MDLRPLHDRVLVKRLDEGEQKIGGIIIPDTAKEKPQQAEVKAVGNGKLLETGERVALDVKPATAFCSANTPAPTSRSRAKNT